MKLLTIILISLLEVIPAGQAFLKPLQPRDSILIADQLEYGFRMDSLAAGTALAFPDFSKVSNDTLTLVKGWRIDTLKAYGPGKDRKSFDITGAVVIAPFEEGQYKLPPIPVLRRSGDRIDTLVFEGLEMEVCTMPVDTASFEIHDIKGQIRYPLTAAEVLPWAGGAVLIAALVIFLIWFIRRRLAARSGAFAKNGDPAYIVALRELDRYRGDKFWAPERQKAYYSGITDILKTYMADRYGIDAPEMTTAELFDALGKVEGLSGDLCSETRDLFELADFVKFAKHTASDSENAAALPLAVRFVTSTHQTEVEKEVQDVL